MSLFVNSLELCFDKNLTRKFCNGEISSNDFLEQTLGHPPDDQRHEGGEAHHGGEQPQNEVDVVKVNNGHVPAKRSQDVKSCLD